MLGVGGRFTANFCLLRKVLSHSESGHRASGKGESPCRGTETTQPTDYAMIHLVMRSLWDLMKRPICSWSKPKCRDQLFRLLEGRAHRRIPSEQKEAYGLDPASYVITRIVFTASVIKNTAYDVPEYAATTGRYRLLLT